MTLIRPARAEDIPAIRAIARAAYAPYVPRIGREPAPMVADFEASQQAARLFVTERVEGFVEAFPLGDEFRLENVAVAPAAAGKGLGGALIGFAEAQARAQGFDRITLYTNLHMTKNLSLYPQLGYRETGRRREDGFDRVYFEKHLS